MLASCAGKKEEPPVEHWQDAKPAILDALDDSRREQARLRIRVEMLQERLNRLQQSVNVQRAQIAALSASLEKIRHPAAPSRVQRTPKPSVSQPPAPSQPERAKSSEPTDSDEIKDAYTAAYLSLKSLRFDEATQAFRTFLKRYPHSVYADQAWYWLGESLYNQKKWNEALQAYHIVAADYPHSVMHAAALLKVALLYRHEGKTDEARAILQRLLREHPKSESASNARALLRSLDESAGEEGQP